MAGKSKPVIKIIMLVIFIAGAILLVRYTPVKSYLTPDAMGAFLPSLEYYKTKHMISCA